MFGFSLGKCVFKLVNAGLWNSDRRVLIIYGYVEITLGNLSRLEQDR